MGLSGFPDVDVLEGVLGGQAFEARGTHGLKLRREQLVIRFSRSCIGAAL
jgi:hypothetical protein